MKLTQCVLRFCRDCADLLATLMGYDDHKTQDAILCATEAFRTMKCPVFAKRYLAGLIKKLNTVSIIVEKAALAAKFLYLEKEKIEKREYIDGRIQCKFWV